MSGILQERSAHNRQYVSALASAYAGMELYNPSYALAKDPNYREKMLRDPLIRHVVSYRNRLVAGRTWRVTPAAASGRGRIAAESPESIAADLMKALLGNIRKFTASREKLADHGIWRGRGHAFIGARRIVRGYAGLAPRPWWTPIRLESIDPNRITYTPEWSEDSRGKRRVRAIVQLAPVDYSEYHILSEADAASIITATWDDEESRLGHGRGLDDALYFYFWAKVRFFQSMLDSGENWSEGMVIGKVDAQASGAAENDAESAATRLLSKLEKRKSRHIIVVDKRDEIDVKWPSGTGFEILIKGLEYLDRKISQLGLAAELPTGGGGSGEGSGSYARAVEEGESTMAMIAGDRDILDDALTHHLIGQMWRMNRRNLVAVGLGGVEQPRFATGEEKRVDAKEGAEIITAAVNAGMRVKEDEAYELLNLTPPAEGDSVIEPRAPAPGGMGFPGFDPFGTNGNGKQEPQEAIGR